MTELTNERLLELNLVHPIHTTERRSFRSCRRRWNWIFREFYYPTVQHRALEFGIAYHEAMETWYDPVTWHDPDREFVNQGLALTVFDNRVKEQLNNYRRLNGEPSPEMKADYEDRVQLGRKMIKYYTEVVSPALDKGFTPVGVEVPFEISMGFNCKCDICWRRYENYLKTKHNVESIQRSSAWEGLPVTYGGRVDMIAQDDHGRLWLFDWKAQPLYEHILTPNGWVQMGDLRVGDLIVGSNGKPTKVTGVFPQGMKEVYRITTRDGAQVEATGDHLWTMVRVDTKTKRTMTTWDLIEELEKENPKHIAFPELEPVEFPERDFPIPPYALGLMLGDGGFTGGHVRFANSDGLEKELPWECNPVGKPGNFSVLGASKVLRELGLLDHLSVDKFIPNDYFYGSSVQRLELLKGLMDTDGYVSKGNAVFCTSSKELRDGVIYLVRSLGGKALLFQDGWRPNATTESYQISIKLPWGLCPFKAKIAKKLGRWRQGSHTHLKILKSVELVGRTETQCIKVSAPDHLYVTRDFLLTHNTTGKIMDEGTEEAFLELEDQVTSYVVAFHRLGRPVAGFVYHEQKKAVPEPPQELKRLMGGRRFSTAKNANTTYSDFLAHVEEHDKAALEAGFYDDYLAWLKREGPQFYQRHQIHRNRHQIANAWDDMVAEARDIIENPRIYPQPSRFGCNTCAFRQPCLGANMNEDYYYTLNTLFEKRTKHYFEEEEVKSSTD